MPIKTVPKRHSRAPRHKHTKNYLQTYWPYLPMVVIIIVGLILGGGVKPLLHPNQSGVLGLATNTTSGGLLDATNSQRASNGKANLKINSQLASAAQTKANDMVARNYWSHNTPDGQQWYVFIKNAGYTYTKAGENLAYGYATSDDTVTGWMNSAEHKANLLDSAFSEVGFGIANSSNFNQSGPETVVVAEYGQPQVLAASTSAPAAAPVASAPKAPVAAPTTPVATPTPTTATPKPNPLQNSDSSPTSKTPTEPASQTITQAGILTGGRAPWVMAAASFMSAFGVIALLIKHGWGFKRVWRDGESFVLHHPLFDTLVVTLVMAGYVLSATKGIIR